MKQSLLLLGNLFLIVSSVLAQDVTTGLITHFPLSETSGTKAVERVAGKDGTLIGGPVWGNPGAVFDGSGNGAQRIDTPVDTANGITNSLTLACWMRLDRALPDGYNEIISKGSAFSFYYYRNRLVFGANFQGAPDLSGGTGYLYWDSGRVLPVGTWVHAAVTYDGTTFKFYMDGTLLGSLAAGGDRFSISNEVITFASTTKSLTIGSGFPRTDASLLGWPGALRDVRVYNRALTAADVSKITSQLSPSYAGLWIGQATLNEVKEAKTGTWGPAPAFSETLLLHVDGENLRLLQEATLMKTRVTAPALPQDIVVTQPALLGNFDGITPRGGKMIGQRFSAATMPLPTDTLGLSKSGEFYQASFTLPADDPRNPFRHKFHPDLGSGRDLPRIVSFTLPPTDSPSDNTITGVVMESISGLNKTAVEARGTVTFTRVSTAAKLNQP
jgi:Concanavalin A-like lectin/glucanases superfamily